MAGNTFFQLPYELRVIVYKYAFSGSTVLISPAPLACSSSELAAIESALKGRRPAQLADHSLGKSCKPPSEPTHLSFDMPDVFSFLRCCRTIYGEGRDIFYSTVPFICQDRCTLAEILESSAPCLQTRVRYLYGVDATSDFDVDHFRLHFPRLQIVGFTGASVKLANALAKTFVASPVPCLTGALTGEGLHPQVFALAKQNPTMRVIIATKVIMRMPGRGSPKIRLYHLDISTKRIKRPWRFGYFESCFTGADFLKWAEDNTAGDWTSEVSGNKNVVGTPS